MNSTTSLPFPSAVVPDAVATMGDELTRALQTIQDFGELLLQEGEQFAHETGRDTPGWVLKKAQEDATALIMRHLEAGMGGHWG
jgi:hypothetical protein